MTIQLQRITTQYDPAEDRIRLTGTDEHGQTHLLWLTQRLLNRLVPNLCNGLEKKSDRPVQSTPATNRSLRTHVEQSFAQQRASAQLPRQAPVVPLADTTDWRVHSVDVKHAPGGARLTFCGTTESQQAALVLPTSALRQWLGIAFVQYRRAEIGRAHV